METSTELKLLQMMLSHATEFEILPQQAGKNGRVGEITLKRRVQRDGSVKWAVYLRGSFVLDKDGDWVFEPIPSNRTDKFLKNTRFEFDDAWERAQAAAVKELKQS